LTKRTAAGPRALAPLALLFLLLVALVVPDAAQARDRSDGGVLDGTCRVHEQRVAPKTREADALLGGLLEEAPPRPMDEICKAKDDKEKDRTAALEKKPEHAPITSGPDLDDQVSDPATTETQPAPAEPTTEPTTTTPAAQPAQATEDVRATLREDDGADDLEVTSRDQVREREPDDPPRLNGDPYSMEGLKAFDMVEEIADLEILDDGPNSDEPAEEVYPGEDALSAEPSTPTSDETAAEYSTSDDSSEDSSGESGDGKYSVFGAYYPVPADETDFEDDYWEERPNGAHRATDISLEEGNPIYAVTDSVVYDIEQQWAGGNVLRLQSTESIPELGIREGDVFVYAHLSQFGDYAEGDSLAAGQQAGLTGNTGEWTTGPHLHFGWKRGDWEPNPYPLLSYLVENGS